MTRVRRLRANNGALNTYIVDYLPLDIGRRFDADVLRVHSLIQLLDQEPDLRLHAGHQSISARAATRDVAGNLRSRLEHRFCSSNAICRTSRAHRGVLGIPLSRASTICARQPRSSLARMGPCGNDAR